LVHPPAGSREWRECTATLAEVLTNTAISSARLYQENKVNLYLPTNVSIPAAVTVFAGESLQAPRSWTERAQHKLIYFHQADKGSHFAVWAQPEIFSEELRAGFRPLRKLS
jgi:hypothetical protein